MFSEPRDKVSSESILAMGTASLATTGSVIIFVMGTGMNLTGWAMTHFL